MSEIDFLNDLEKFEYNKEEFFLWCEDDEIKIGFSQIPDI